MFEYDDEKPTTHERLYKLTHSAARELGMNEDAYLERHFQACIKQHPAEAIFMRRINEALTEHPIPGIQAPSPRLNDILHIAFSEYFLAFAQKITLGEMYAERHPDISPHRNRGYKVGNTLVDLATQRLYDDVLTSARNTDGERLSETQRLRLLGQVIKYMLAPIHGQLQPREDDLIEPHLMQVHPQPRQKWQGMQTPEDFIAALRNQSIVSARSWAPADHQDFVGLLEQQMRADGLLAEAYARAYPCR